MDFSSNPEEILLEPGMLETCQVYREKKTKPLLGSNRQNAAFPVSGLCGGVGLEYLQEGYDRLKDSIACLSERLHEVCFENKAPRQISADYERINCVFDRRQ